MRDLTRYARGIAYLTIMILATGGADYANAGLFTVDQSQTVLDEFVNLVFASPAGQEFKPIFSSLNGIEIFLEDAFVGRGPQAKFALTIHDGSLGGPDIGTSRIVTLTSGFIRDVVFFDFPSPVSLAPEHLYVFGIEQLEGSAYSFGATAEDLYSRGRAVVNGNPVPPGFLVQDLYFREGVIVAPESATVALLVMGFLALFGLGRIIGR